MRNQNTFSHACGDKTWSSPNTDRVFLWCLNFTRPQVQCYINMQLRNVEKKRNKTPEHVVAAKYIYFVFFLNPTGPMYNWNLKPKETWSCNIFAYSADWFVFRGTLCPKCDCYESVFIDNWGGVQSSLSAWVTVVHSSRWWSDSSFSLVVSNKHRLLSREVRRTLWRLWGSSFSLRFLRGGQGQTQRLGAAEIDQSLFFVFTVLPFGQFDCHGSIRLHLELRSHNLGMRLCCGQMDLKLISISWFVRRVDIIHSIRK